MGKNGHRTTTVLFFSIFPYYEGLQLEICIFLLTLKLPKSCPLNKGYQHDAPLGLFVFKEHPELLKSFLHPIPFERSSRGPSEGLQAGFTGSPLQEARCSGLVPLLHTSSPNCVECLQNKDDTKPLDVAFVVLFEEQSSDSGGDAAEGLKTPKSREWFRILTGFGWAETYGVFVQVIYTVAELK